MIRKFSGLFCGIFALTGVFTAFGITSDEANESLPTPDFVITFLDDDQIKESRLMDPTSPFLSEDYFTPQTAAMLLTKYGVTAEGYVSTIMAYDHVDINGKYMYPKCMLGNDTENGELTFHFSDEFLSGNGGLHIREVALTNCVNGYSADPVPVYANAGVTEVPFRTWFPAIITIPEAPSASTLTIRTEAGKGIGFDQIYVYLSPTTSKISHVEVVAGEESYWSIDGKQVKSDSQGIVICRAKDGTVSKIVNR